MQGFVTDIKHSLQANFIFAFPYLSIPVAECDGDDEALEAVEDDVEVFVGGLPLAVRVDLWPGKVHRSSTK